MRGQSLTLILFGLFASPLSAADPQATAPEAGLPRPTIAAPANWVIAAAIPPVPSSSDGAATINLLSDTQERFQTDGDSTYHAATFQIASPKGLEEGALQIGWDPTLETLILHRYRILRDGREIDLLGDGSKLTVIRRETNMENAVLDGELTASLQPEDLRVGDIIDFAFTLTRHDPVMGGRSESLSGPLDGVKYGHYRLRMIWPKGKELHWRASAGVVQPELIRSASDNELVAELTNVTTPRPPDGAPSRYQLVNSVEITEFPDWASISRAFAPLYAQASTLGDKSPVKALAAEIAASTADPKTRAERALKLVQEQIRYLFLGMNDGGFVPASADVTWARRFGDCKAKTVLLVALLHELGIDARPVLTNTEKGDFVAKRLPAMAAFDHAVVEARIANRVYWLDGTRLGDTKLENIETPDWHVGLPIVPDGAGLVTLTPDQPMVPSETTSIALDATAGIDLPATASAEIRFRGQTATDMRVKYAGMSATDREASLRKLWHDTYDFVSPKTIEMGDDPKTGDFLLTMRGVAKMDWSPQSGVRWYELDRARLGWKFDVARDGELTADAPYAFDYPDYWESRETIRLPNGGKDFRLQGGSVDQTIGGLYAFHRKVAIESGVLTMEASTRALTDELPASKAQSTHDEMAALADVGIFVRVPDNYMRTDQEIAALREDKAANANAYLLRAAQRFDERDVKGSLSDANAALALDPQLAKAHSVRALALAAENDPAAEDAAARAIALDGKQWLAWIARGLIAFEAKHYSEAETDFSTALTINPRSERAFAGRGGTRLSMGHFAEALADFDSALAISPALPMHIPRAAALLGLGRSDEALAEANRAVTDHPSEPQGYLLRATLQMNAGHRELALEDFSWVVEHAPSAEHLVKRASAWPDADKAHRMADVEAALRLAPHNIQALGLRARQAIDDEKFVEAEADITAVETIEPDSAMPASLGIMMLEKQGRFSEALAIADRNVAKHPGNASALNERCWLKVTRSIEFDTALADCEAAKKLSPTSAAILDSRAFVLFRMGKSYESIAQFDEALKLSPHLPSSLFGRGLAKAQVGNRAGALIDLSEARTLSPGIDARFGSFGMKVPDDLDSAPSGTAAH